MPNLTDYLIPFINALIGQLSSDQERHGNTWYELGPKNQETRICRRIDAYYSAYNQEGVPLPWLKIAGLAFIGWVRENNPNLWKQ